MTDLEKIREAVVQAWGGYDDYGGLKTHRGYELVAENDKITLADVLLAIHKRHKENFATVASNGWFHFGGGPCYWNLEKTLEEQREETLKFIADLL